MACHRWRRGAYQIPHEREVELSFQAAVEVVIRDQVLQREVAG